MSGTVTVTPGYTWTSGSDVLSNSKLNQSANPSMLVADGAITSKEIDFASMPTSPQTCSVLFEDFLQTAPAIGTTAGKIGVNNLYRSASSSPASVESVASTALYAGLVKLTDPSTSAATGWMMIRGQAGSEAWLCGSGAITVEWKINSPVTLSAVAGETYFLYIGLANSASNATAPTDGVYFTYTDAVSSGAWVGTTTKASVSTSVVGSAMVVSTDYKLKAVINATGTSVEFFINGTSIGTSTSNIPTAALTYCCASNVTYAASSDCSFKVDWLRIQKTFSTNR